MKKLPPFFPQPDGVNVSVRERRVAHLVHHGNGVLFGSAIDNMWIELLPKALPRPPGSKAGCLMIGAGRVLWEDLQDRSAFAWDVRHPGMRAPSMSRSARDSPGLSHHVTCQVGLAV